MVGEDGAHQPARDVLGAGQRLTVPARLAVDADADLHLVGGQVEGRPARGGNGAGGQRHTHGAAVLVDPVRDGGHRIQVASLLGGGTHDLLQQHRQADAPASRGVQRVLDGNVVGDHHRRHAHASVGGQLRRHLEVHDIARVVLHDVQPPRTRLSAGGGGQHLVGGRGGEHLAYASRIQHPGPDETAMQWLMAGATPGDHRDLPGAGGLGAEDHAVVMVDADILVGGPNALESLRYHVVG